MRLMIRDPCLIVDGNEHIFIVLVGMPANLSYLECTRSVIREFQDDFRAFTEEGRSYQCQTYIALTFKIFCDNYGHQNYIGIIAITWAWWKKIDVNHLIFQTVFLPV